MKVLFVCNGNVGRSQAAMAYYNQLHPGDAVSAGTLVETPGQQLGERPGASHIVTVMNEHGIDMSKNVRTPLTEEMLNGIDKVIMMADPETHPQYLQGRRNVEFWDVEDAKNKPLERTREIRDELKARVEELIKRTAS